MGAAEAMTSDRGPVLLDTSVLILPPIAGLPSIADAICVSAITVAELEYGIGISDPLEDDVRQHRLQAVTASLEVLSFDRAAASAYGVLARAVRAAGRDPRPRRLDLLIAATAVRYGLPMATRNAKDFRHLERALTVIDVQD